MGNNWNKYKLLMWKNYKLQVRKKVSTAFEVLIPVLCMALLLAMKSFISSDRKPEEIYDSLPLNTVDLRIYHTLLYTVTNPADPQFNDAFFRKLALDLKTDGVPLKFSDSKSLEAYYVKQNPDSFGIEINNNNADDIKITLRFLPWESPDSTKNLYPIIQSPGPSSNRPEGTGAYYRNLFLHVQYYIAQQITPTSPQGFPTFSIQRFPDKTYIDDEFLVMAPYFIPILFTISFMLTCLNTVRYITLEKEKQLKETMKIMGLPNWMHWVAWFTKTFAQLIITIILMTILLTVDVTNSAIFQFSDPSVVFVFLVLYLCATITFCFLISVFFSKASTAASVSGVLTFVGFAPYSIMQSSYSTLALGSKLGGSLLTNTAMSFGIQILIMFEGTENGVQWSNLFTPNSPDDNLSMGAIMLMLILDCAIYLLLALYIEQVFPGEYGVKREWYFPFTARFWCSPKPSSDENLLSHNAEQSQYFEAEPKQLHAGVQIKNIKKTFGNHTAVKGLSLNLYEGQITSLLGHNGAGKTTTMSMLTGMFSPTNGTAIVNGFDIRTDITNVRDSLGLCPQHNVLYDNLTVREHLYFFAKLKGLEGLEIEEEIKLYLKLLEFEDKADVFSSMLSGGMKRKLSVGIALCGKSKVVMLDEPTAGIDPSARRALWDFLKLQKQGRTILLTTHFMDEADLLGDRIAIMADGELKCCGSSFFLKKKYGAGYHLILDKAQNCKIDEITKLIKTYIPNVVMENNVGTELTYLLTEEHATTFESMLRELENNFQKLGINSYGISLTTLEEVFLKVGADHNLDVNINNNSNGSAVYEINPSMKYNNELVTGCNLILNQILAMFLKKLLSTIRSWRLLFMQIIIPIALILVSVLAGKSSSGSKNDPPLTFTLDSYNDPITIVEQPGSSSYYTTYVNEIDAQKHKTEITSNFVETMLEKDNYESRFKYIVGAVFDKNNITCLFSDRPYHATPLSVSLALNAVYQKLAGVDKKITFISHPLPYIEDPDSFGANFNNMGFSMTINFGISLIFILTLYIMFYIKERLSNATHLQTVCGILQPVFWFTAYICDIIIFILISIFIIITMVALNEDGFNTAEQLGSLFLIMLIYALATLPLLYVASFVFKQPTAGFTRMLLLGTLTGTIGFIAVYILKIAGRKDIGNPIDGVLSIFPFYSVDVSISRMSDVAFRKSQCEISLHTSPLCNGTTSYFDVSETGIGQFLLIMSAEIIIFFACLFAIDYKLINTLISKTMKRFSQGPLPVANEDNDVANERHKIQSLTDRELKSDYAIVLKDVTKYYKNFLAVNGINLGVKPYECFGLLGINGAGKTTTFKMMTGDLNISYGNAWVQSFNLKSQLQTVQKHIGYCPQFDALLEDLTARETLNMFCLIRGVPRTHCKDVLEKLANDFDFFKHLDKQVKQLSGGNKRKLSTAIALIGDPPVIYLDEPTAGMDPATKRFLWNTLSQLRDRGKCIILTSHSMEECEALCTRLAIMVNGSFQCLGSTQHLKSKFAEGYSLTIKILSDESVRDPNTEHVEQYVHTHFKSVQLREKHQELLTFHIAEKSMPWSQMFGILERGKKILNIEDYSIGQSSLEQVFLTFTNKQVMESYGN